MAFTLTSINKSKIPETGGHELLVYGTYEPGHSYRVYIGNTKSSADFPCYSGKPGQGNILFPRRNLVIRCFTPMLPPDVLLPAETLESVTVKDVATLETHILEDVLGVTYQIFLSTVFAVKHVLPSFYRTGPRNIEQVPPV